MGVICLTQFSKHHKLPSQQGQRCFGQKFEKTKLLPTIINLGPLSGTIFQISTASKSYYHFFVKFCLES